MNFQLSKDSWKIIETYIKKQLNRHHLDSFEAFIDTQLIQILKQFNPIKISYDYDANHTSIESKLY